MEHKVKLDTLFKELDTKYYCSALHVAGWRAHYFDFPKGEFGMAVPDSKWILIARHHLDTPENPELRRTLTHEMIHAWLYLNNHQSHHEKNEAHGAAFFDELKRLAAAGEDLHGEEEYLVCGDISEENVAAAAKVYFARKSGKESPGGGFKGGKWFPDSAEYRRCCEKISQPSKTWSNSLRDHCKTISHISRLFGVDTVALRAKVKEMDLHQKNSKSPEG